MTYVSVADIVVILHALWVLFLIFGGFWGRRVRIVKYIHITGLCLALIIETGNLICPVTHVEVWLRSRGNPAGGYSGSFIVHYLEALLYIEISRPLIVVLTIALCAGNFYLYRRKP